MKALLFLIARVVIAAAFLAAGVIVLFDSVRGVITRLNGDWLFLFFLVPFTLVCCGLLFASGYFLLRRHYRHFASIWVVLGAFAVFGFFLGLPKRVQHILSLSNSDERVGLLHIASLFAAFYAARWFVQAAFRVLDRHLPRDSHNPAAIALLRR